MANTERTRSALLDLAADSVVGSISAQDLRDMLVSILPAEHINAYDFWNHPNPESNTTINSTRGWHLHSQIVSSTIANGFSFGVVYQKNASNIWSTLQVSHRGLLGVAADSYTANVSTAKMLLMGVVYQSDLSNVTASCVGLPAYVLSITSCVGGFGMSITAADESRVIGFVLNSGIGQSTAVGSNKWFFDQRWSVYPH